MARSLSLIVAVALLAGACGKGQDSEAAAGVIAAWKAAGLEAGSFAPVDGKALGGGKCSAGAVSGIDATLCEYPDAPTARRAEAAGLAQVSNATGLALAQGRMLLVLSDPDRKDPSGKHINEIARIFRNR
jgi:hypothetical protein